MFNIGIDFGSTYTTVSAYRNETEKLETVVLGLGTPYIPTIAGGKVGSLDGLRYGSAAKGIMGRKDHVMIAMSLCWRNSVLQQNSITKTIVQKRIVSRKNNTQEM